MTALADRANTALVVIDLQNGVLANAYRRDAVLGAVGRLVVTGAQTDDMTQRGA